MTDKIPGRALNMWLLTAVIPPILSVSGRTGWMGAMFAGLVCGVLCWLVGRYTANPLPRWACILELLWLVVFLGGIAGESGICWKEKQSVIAVILILLAAFVSFRGCDNAARTGATLTWLVLPVLGAVTLAGLTDIDPDWISMSTEIPDGMQTVLLLTPCLMVFFPDKQNRKGKWIPWLLALTAVLASVLLETTVGEHIQGNGFLEFSKGVSIFGVAERFEALVACALSIGWFSLFCLIFGAMHQLMKEICPKAAGIGVWFCAGVAAGLMYVLPKNGGWLVVGNLIFWVFLPLITQGLVVAKKVVKK